MTPIQSMQFTVPGLAAPKGRPRFALIGGKTRVYTPAKTLSFEGCVAKHAYLSATTAEWEKGKDDVVTMHVTFYRQHLLKGGDVDNLGKSVLDGCSKVLYNDDCRVVSAQFVVRQLGKGQGPETQVLIARYSRKDWCP